MAKYLIGAACGVAVTVVVGYFALLWLFRDVYK